MTSADEYDEQRRRRQIADVVLYWMRRRGLTRQVFADRLGKSVSWVDKIKNGDRQLDRLSVLRRISQVLDIPLQVLIDPEEAERQRLCPDDRDVAAIRSALRRYDVITNVFRPDGDVLPEPNLAQLERSVRYGWMSFQTSNYQAIGQLLPDLIRTAQAAVWQLDGDDQRTAKGWLAWTYQLTAATAFKLGDAQLGWIAADRLSPHLDLTDVAFVSAYGMLLLKGSIAAAQLHQAADVRDLQAEALNIATRLGSTRDVHWSSFGTTNVRVHQVSALADMHSGGRVIEAAARNSHADLMSLPKERRASHLVEVTRGYLQAGMRDEAANALLDADEFAPGEVRCRRTTHQLVEELVRSYPRGSKPPAALANVIRAVGVTA